ncbi:hypothetical protein Bbelb_020790 [Branchiostoma belcheri]|nr:hypothetical protein Bbelb_020790 [Branchiostoma belcheri]
MANVVDAAQLAEGRAVQSVNEEGQQLTGAGDLGAAHLASIKKLTGWNAFFRSVALSNYETTPPAIMAELGNGAGVGQVSTVVSNMWRKLPADRRKQWHEAVDSKPKLDVRAVFVDISRAFNTINHYQLLETPRDMGIRRSLWNTISSHLGNACLPLSVVPVKYTDDLTSTEVLMGTLPGQTQMALDSVVERGDQFSLSANAKKTKDMVISARKADHAPNPPHPTIAGHEIGRVVSFKLLGVYISSHLTWDSHGVRERVTRNGATVAKEKEATRTLSPERQVGSQICRGTVGISGRRLQIFQMCGDGGQALLQRLVTDVRALSWAWVSSIWPAVGFFGFFGGSVLGTVVTEGGGSSTAPPPERRCDRVAGIAGDSGGNKIRKWLTRDTGILWRTLALEVADFAGVEDSDRSTDRVLVRVTPKCLRLLTTCSTVPSKVTGESILAENEL